MIDQDQVNTEMDDIATALTASIAKDGQTTPTADLPMGSYKHTGVAAATARTHYAQAGEVQDGAIIKITSVAGTNTITAAAPLSLAAYAVGQEFTLVPANDNTGAATLNINSIGAGAVQLNGAALVGGELQAGVPVTVYVSAVTPVFEITGNGSFMPKSGGNMTGGINGAETTVASATTPDIFAITVGNLIDYTGTATCTGFVAAPQAGAERTLVCAGAAVFTAGANMLIDGVTSGNNFTASAGDKIIVRAVGTTQFRLTPQKYNGTAVVADMPRAYLAGLSISNNGTDPTNDIDIAAGACRDSTNAADMVLASALTKQLDAAWAVGTNAGGLDTGSIANGVYHIWLIKRSDTGVIDALFSTSATAPTMPTNYDYKRRIASIIRASGAIRAFVQDGDYFRLKASVLDVGSTNPGTSSITAALSVPSGINVFALINVEMDLGATSASSIYVRDISANDEAPSGSAAPLATMRTVASGTNIANIQVRTNTSSQIAWRINYSDASSVVRMATLGWIDDRGKNA